MYSLYYWFISAFLFFFNKKRFMMSSKKGYSLEQVDDCNCDVAVADASRDVTNYPRDDTVVAPPPDLQEEYCEKNKTPVVTKKTKVSDEEFVRKWMSCDSYVVMSFNTGMTVSAVQARRTRLRKAGVQLPSFTRATRKTKEIDVAGLNTMIEAVEGSEHYEPETDGE